jgi:hypothetical protein
MMGYNAAGLFNTVILAVLCMATVRLSGVKCHDYSSGINND